MEFQTILDFVKNNSGATYAIGIGSVVVILYLREKIGFHLWYFIVLAVAGIVSVVTGRPLYFWPFLLGMMTAFAEVISKFPDEPLKALKAPHALFYHILNGLIAAFALYILMITGFKNETPGDQLKNVTLAGLGSMLVMRSKLFDIKVADKDISFGPEQIIKILLDFMSDGMDRVRARYRFEFVKKTFFNLKFDEIYNYSVINLNAAQALGDKKKTDCVNALKKVKISARETRNSPLETQLRSCELGYILITTMGEGFVSDLFANPPEEWKIDPKLTDDKTVLGKIAALPGSAVGMLKAAIPFGASELVFAYGANMSENWIRERLGWTDSEGMKSLKKSKPVKCELQGYELVFNKPSDEKPTEEAFANIVPKPGRLVEGVIYQLPQSAIDSLDKNEKGYRRIEVEVMVKGKKRKQQDEKEKKKAQVFIADPQGLSLPPNRKELAAIIEGAEKRHLSESYVNKLKSHLAEAVVKAHPNSGRVVEGSGTVKV